MLFQEHVVLGDITFNLYSTSVIYILLLYTKHNINTKEDILKNMGNLIHFLWGKNTMEDVNGE